MHSTDRRHILGKYGEGLAADYLTGLGLRVIDRNFHTRFGEIDLVCEDKDALVFVEVKTRNSGSHQAGFEAIDQIKLKRIRDSIAQWRKQNPGFSLPTRIDAVSITVLAGRVAIDHLKQVG